MQKHYTNDAWLQVEHSNMLSEVDVSTRGHSPSGDISAEGQHYTNDAWLQVEHSYMLS